MSAGNRKGTGTNRGWAPLFWAVVKYELLWNIRKKKFLGMVTVAFVLATLGLALPVILSSTAGQPLQPNPDYAVNIGGGASAGLGSFGFFLFALVTVMNSISGEFESGTIVPLLTKPVSRTLIFIGKLFAAFLVLLSTYTVLFLFTTVGGTIVYGPQNNLHLVPLTLLGNLISTFVWVAIVLAIGSLSKSSVIAALGALGIFIALLISAPIVSVFSSQAWALTYVPGNGATGSLRSTVQGQNMVTSKPVSTGTDSIAANLVNWVLYPSAEVSFSKVDVFKPGQPYLLLYTEPISLILGRSIAVALVYILALLLIAWYAFRRAQVAE